jgi:serine/threonine-protein kinase
MSDRIDRLNGALEGRYAIERELGEGGMATVYLAHDVRHDRRVAIKVLKPELAAVVGGERFLTEIKTTANLQHPHILPLFDSGEADGFLYYVMPFVDGESLEDKLEREKQLPIAECVSIATRVASALQSAHEQGVIHRDIKPANILLAGGEPLVADFGIALAVQDAGGGRLTETGLSLGTPYYMSPEQAAADRTPDARSDVYSLGCVLFEMLTGGPPFQGNTAQAVLANILTGKVPELREQRSSTPPNVAAATARALERLPADRFESAAGFARALEDPGFRHLTADSVPPASGSAVWRRASLALAGLSVALTGLSVWALQRDPFDRGVTPQVRESTIVLPDSTPLGFVGAGPLGVGQKAFAVSPDGATLVFVGRSGGSTRLYARALDGDLTRVLAGTDGAYGPFYSPDSEWVGYFSGPNLMKVRVDGGAPVPLAEVTLPYGGAWLPDDRILVAGNEGDELVWIPAAGGAPMALLDADEDLVFPYAFPGGEDVLVSTSTSLIARVSIPDASVRWLTASGWTDERPTEAALRGTQPGYASSGHLIYLAPDGAVMAIPYDAEAHEVLGDPTPVLSGVRIESIWGAGQLEVTADGALFYAAGENARNTWLAWRDDEGAVDTLAAFGRANYGELDLAPDGTRLVIWTCSAGGACGWEVLSIGEGLRASLASGSREATWWDDRRLIELSGGWRSGDPSAQAWTELFPADNEAVRERLDDYWVLDVARDGAVVAATSAGTLAIGTSRDALGSVRETDLSVADGWGHVVRPGGDWIAYTSQIGEEGEWQVYLARTRPPYERIRVSPRGGEEPVWSPDGDLVYREGNRWMSVTPPDGTGRPGAARFLFEGPYVNVLGRSHDVAPDGRHLLVVSPPEGSRTQLTLVTNWVQQLPLVAPPRRP